MTWTASEQLRNPWPLLRTKRIEKLGQVADVLDVAKPGTNIAEAVYRLSSMPAQVSAIIARIVNNGLWTDENMTAVSRAMLHKARMLGKEPSSKLVWNRQGTTFMKKDESVTVYCIPRTAGLDKAALRQTMTFLTCYCTRLFIFPSMSVSLALHILYKTRSWPTHAHFFLFTLESSAFT